MKEGRIKKNILFRLLRFGWRKTIHIIRNLRGEPEQIAWGGAIGTFISVTPTFGLQTLLAFFVATLFKANRIVSVAFVYITNFFTVIPVYFFTGWIGIKILNRDVHHESFYTALKGAFANLSHGEYQLAYDFFWKYFLALWVGAVVVGVIGGVIVFVFLYYSSKSYYKLRKKRKEARLRKRGQSDQYPKGISPEAQSPVISDQKAEDPIRTDGVKGTIPNRSASRPSGTSKAGGVSSENKSKDEELETLKTEEGT